MRAAVRRPPRVQPAPRTADPDGVAALVRLVLLALSESLNERIGALVTPALAGLPAGWPVRRSDGLTAHAVMHPSSSPRHVPIADAGLDVLSGGASADATGADVLDTDADTDTDTEDERTGAIDDGAHAVAIDREHVETWRLVERAQHGDGDAFGQLYDRYVDSVFRFIYYRVNDRPLAEDFTSETFLRALRRITTISYQGRDIGAWFITIARNIVLDHVKSARNRLESTTGDVLESSEYTASTESLVLDSLTAEGLMQAVAQLGDEQRECVMLRFMQGLSVSETAAVLGKNEGAVKALQHRAVRKLAELVGDSLR